MSKEFFQEGKGKGRRILLVGESPSSKGWHKGYACRNAKGNLLPTGNRLNELLLPFALTADECGFAELCQSVLKDRKHLSLRAKKDWPAFLGNVKKSGCRLLVILGAETTRVFSTLSGTNLKPGDLEIIMLGGKKYRALSLYHPSPVNPKNREKNRRILRRLAPKIRKLVK